MRFCPVLDSDGMDTYRASDAVRGVVQRISDQGRLGPDVEIRYAPRSSTPQAKSFSESKRVAMDVDQVGTTESSKEIFSSKLFVGSSILRMALEQREV